MRSIEVHGIYRMRHRHARNKLWLSSARVMMGIIQPDPSVAGGSGLARWILRRLPPNPAGNLPQYVIECHINLPTHGEAKPWRDKKATLSPRKRMTTCCQYRECVSICCIASRITATSMRSSELSPNGKTCSVDASCWKRLRHRGCSRADLLSYCSMAVAKS